MIDVRCECQAVGAVAEITGIIGPVKDIQTVIAASVEEQAATTSEIGRSVTEAAEGSSGIARSGKSNGNGTGNGHRPSRTTPALVEAGSRS